MTDTQKMGRFKGLKRPATGPLPRVGTLLDERLDSRLHGLPACVAMKHDDLLGFRKRCRRHLVKAFLDMDRRCRNAGLQDGNLLADPAQLFLAERMPFAAAVAGKAWLATTSLEYFFVSDCRRCTSLTAEPKAEKVSRSLRPTFPNITLPTCRPMP